MPFVIPIVLWLDSCDDLIRFKIHNMQNPAWCSHLYLSL
ncbi:hypothetical protein [Bacillus phage FI_KG-Lek]|nr:hypothetical protein [Bacillus phage FI_KG-Lek]